MTPGVVDDILGWEPRSPLEQLARQLSTPFGRPPLIGAHRVSIAIILATANLIGVLVVLGLNLLVIPGEAVPWGAARSWAFPLIGAYAIAAFAAGAAVLLGASRRQWAWLHELRTPTADEQVAILRVPRLALFVQLALWLGAVLLVTGCALTDTWRLTVRVGFTTLLGGVTVSAFGYVLTERAMRPVARVLLAHDSPNVAALPGTATRQLLTWGLGTGAPVIGLWIIGLLFLTGANPSSAGALAVSMVVLASIVLTAGLLAELLTARAVGDPIKQLRIAAQSLGRGQLQQRVAIDDATEVGLLQAQFNEMAAGLQEREAMRDLFGRHVGIEVAETAISRGIELGGEQREVSAIFVDIIGSTALASTHPAEEVVGLINTFFDVVIDITERHGGLVNKFAGDGALVVFGAPLDHNDHQTSALRAARELSQELQRRAPQTPSTIGVSSGQVIAGNMGSRKRFEYTVMGDAVNEASRLGVQAKSLPHRVAAAGHMLQSAHPTEAAHWSVAHSVVLRGRNLRTDVATPKTLG